MQAESEELVKFREEWKAEIKHRTIQSRVLPSGDAKPDLPSSPSQTAVDHTSFGLERKRLLSSDYSQPPSVDAQVSSVQARIPKAQPLSSTLVSAVETYRLATQYEQAGELDEALRLYRNAFRLDANVDKAYRREELRLEAAARHTESDHVKERRKQVPAAAEKVTPTKARSKPRQLAGKHSHSVILTQLLLSFPDDLDFVPTDEAGGSPLQRVPDEIIILILKILDPHSIERFALLSRKARVLSLDTSIWRCGTVDISSLIVH